MATPPSSFPGALGTAPLVFTVRRGFRWGAGPSGPSFRDRGHYPRGVSGGTLAVAAREAPGPEEMITMMFWNGGGGAWWQAGLMWAGMIAFWGLLIWLVYALFTGATRRAGHPGDGQEHRGSDALRILDERLARGEIDTEEYRRLREALGGGAGRNPAGTGGGTGSGR